MENANDVAGVGQVAPSKWDKRREREGQPRRKDLIRANPGYRRAYTTWVSMVQRCTDPNATKYRWYGAKGIAVCARWRDFDLFLADMGERPDGLTLDRIDGSKGYEPGNCRWATATEQAHNRADFKARVARIARLTHEAADLIEPVDPAFAARVRRLAT